MGDITIEGTIDVSGGAAENALNNTTAPALGGMAIAGGGQGGFGGVCADPKSARITLDKAADIQFRAESMIFSVPIGEEWGAE